MKNQTFCCSLQTGMLCGAFMLFCASASAIPYTENLNDIAPAGTEMGPGNGPPLSVGVTADGYAGGHSTLTFALSNNGGNQLQVGDVLIYCDPAQTVLMDVLRFEDWGVGYVFVYSTPAGGPNLGDTGLPTTLQANTISFTEQFNGTNYGLFNYTPTVGEPGYSTYNPGQTVGYTYDFTSDSTGTWSVPDGGTTASLLGMGVLALAGFRRKFNF